MGCHCKGAPVLCSTVTTVLSVELFSLFRVCERLLWLLLCHLRHKSLPTSHAFRESDHLSFLSFNLPFNPSFRLFLSLPPPSLTSSAIYTLSAWQSYFWRLLSLSQQHGQTAPQTDRMGENERGNEEERKKRYVRDK